MWALPEFEPVFSYSPCACSPHHCRWRRQDGMGCFCIEIHSSATSRSQCGTIPACCGLVASKYLRLTVTHTALPFVPSHLQTGSLQSHLRGPGCMEDLQAGSLGTFKEPLSHLITFPFRKSFLTSESACCARPGE